MEQLVILVIIGLISLVNWLIQRSSELREKRRLEQKRMGMPEGVPERGESQEPEPAPQAAPVDPAAEMRKLMEALGLPVEDEPPVVRRAPTPPPAPELPPAPPPLPMWQPGRSEVRASPLPVPAAAPVPKVMPAIRNRWAGELRSRDGIRRAMVLREILGPPKALDS